MLKRLQQLAEAQEKKREAAAKLLTRKPSTSPVTPPAPASHTAPAKPRSESAPAAPVVVESLAGRANVPLFRDDESEASIISKGLARLVDLYLHAARHRTRHVALAWPASPSTLPLVHALATLERWKDGDKRGVRGVLYPTKSNAFHALNHLHLGRLAVLEHARALLEVGPNPAVTGSLPEKDAFLFALNSLRADAADQFNPSVSELLPLFLATPGFKGWTACTANLLSHLSAKLTRRAQAKALKRNCAVVGEPATAPDALFALDGRMSDTEITAALKALANGNSPEVVLILATRTVRGPGSGWKGKVARFCLKLEKVFGSKCPGVIVVTDEPHAAYAIKDELWTHNLKREQSDRWRGPNHYAISGVPFTARADGLLAAGQAEKAHPLPRELNVHVVDNDVAKVVRTLMRIANAAPGGRDGAKPVTSAIWYLTRMAALPCGIADLTTYLAAPEIADATRAAFDWPAHIGALHEFERQGGIVGHRADMLECIRRGSALFTKYQAATPFALKLAELVETASTNRDGVVVVFTSSLQKLLAERFLARYDDYPLGGQFADFKTRVQLLVAAQLEDDIGQFNGATVIFAGLNEESLRFVVSDDRVPAHAPILLTQRNAQVLRAALTPIATKFPEFKSFKPRIESILRQLVDLPEDASVLASSDYVLPTFRVELSGDVSNGPGEMDPDAWRICLEDGVVQYRRPSHKVYVYDPASHLASDKGFRSCEVESLNIGDKVFVMSADLREMVEHVLREAGVPIQSDKTFEGALRAYHLQVAQNLAARFPARSRADQVRALRREMVAINPRLEAELPGEQAMRHWVDLGESTNTPFEQLRPQAPLKEANFQAFAHALGFSSLEAAYQWQRVILAVRNSRRLDGRHVSDIYAYMLLQPESAMVHSNIKRQTLKLLFDRARASVSTVEAVGPLNSVSCQ